MRETQVLMHTMANPSCQRNQGLAVVLSVHSGSRPVSKQSLSQARLAKRREAQAVLEAGSRRPTLSLS